LALLELTEMEQQSLHDGWSPKALLAHVAFWDDFQRRRMQAALQGDSAQSGFARPLQDNDGRARQDDTRSLDEILAGAESARDRLVAFAASLDTSALEITYPEGQENLSLDRLLTHMAHHTRSHEAEVARYCGSSRRWDRSSLRHLLATQHDAMMDSIAGLEESTILSVRLPDGWTIRDHLVHILAWSENCYLVVDGWPTVSHATISAWLEGDGESLDDVNARLLAQRAAFTMIDVADQLAAWHRRLLRRLDGMREGGLAEVGDFGWGKQGELSEFLFGVCLHQAQHAEAIWRWRWENRSPRH
jgi:hypothetical protein